MINFIDLNDKNLVTLTKILWVLDTKLFPEFIVTGMEIPLPTDKSFVFHMEGENSSIIKHISIELLTNLLNKYNKDLDEDTNRDGD